MDANQIESWRVTLYDGSVECFLQDRFGTLNRAARLYGQVWTTGSQVAIRHYEAHPPDGNKGPISAVARLGED